MPKGQIPWNKGLKGPKQSEETIRKRALANTGKKRTPETCLRISLGNKGKKRTEEFRKRMSETRKGRPSCVKGKRWTISPEIRKHFLRPSIKRDITRAEYLKVHTWVRRTLGAPTKCEHCGKDGLTGRFIQWSNKDNMYRYNVEDWQRLCGFCHRKYDKRFLVKKLDAFMGEKCKECDGRGFFTEHNERETHSGEDGSCLECPIQVQCEDCKGEGTIK